MSACACICEFVCLFNVYVSAGTIPERAREADERVAKSTERGGGGGAETQRRGTNTQTDTQKHIMYSLNDQHVCMLFVLYLSLFQERRILEETATPLNPSGLLIQQTGKNSPARETSETAGRDVPLQNNGQRISTGSEDQHASKLHFFQGETHAEIHTDL